MDVMAEKIKYFLFAFLLFTFSLGEIARYQLQGGIAVKALDIGVFLFLFLSLSLAGGKIRRSPLLKPVFIFFFIAALSLIVNFYKLGTFDLLEAALYLVRWILYAGVYFMVYSLDVKFKNRIPNMLLASGAFIVFMGFLQYFLYPDLRNLMYMGWDEHFYRLFSVFLDPNFAGFFLVLYFLFLLGFIFGKKPLMSQALLAITFFAIILTFSRSSYLMLIVGLFIFLFLEKKKKLIFYSGLVLVFTVLAISLFGAKSEGTNLLRTTSTLARVESYQDAAVIFKNNPILGLVLMLMKMQTKNIIFLCRANILITELPAQTAAFYLF